MKSDDLRRGKTLSEPVKGELTVRAALERLLTDSGLTYEFLDERTGADTDGRGKRERQDKRERR